MSNNFLHYFSCTFPFSPFLILFNFLLMRTNGFRLPSLFIFSLLYLLQKIQPHIKIINISNLLREINCQSFIKTAKICNTFQKRKVYSYFFTQLSQTFLSSPEFYIKSSNLTLTVKRIQCLSKIRFLHSLVSCKLHSRNKFLLLTLLREAHFPVVISVASLTGWNQFWVQQVFLSKPSHCPLFFNIRIGDK